MVDDTPDNFDVIDEGDILSPLPVTPIPPEKIHLYELTSIESFLKKLQQLMNEGKSLENFTITINNQKRDLSTLIVNQGILTTNNIAMSINNPIDDPTEKLCRCFEKSSDRRHHIRGETPYIVFFTPNQEIEVRENKRGIINGTVDGSSIPQRVIFPCDPHNVSQSISKDKIPTSTFAMLATPSITLDEADNIVSINWHVESPTSIDLSNITPDVLSSLSSQPPTNCHIRTHGL